MIHRFHRFHRFHSIVALTLVTGLVTGRTSPTPVVETPAKQTEGAHTPKVSAAIAPSVPLPTLKDTAPRDYPGIHNAVAYHEGYVSGSVPEGDAGFDTLAAMGIKTIISVDGAQPEVDKAEARGMRYIHLPIGYNGLAEERKLQLVRASRDAMVDGPIYIHCHHGRHRSAGAAATVAASLGWETSRTGVERMKVSGTAPNYTGLYACATDAVPLTVVIIDQVPAHFPSVWKPSNFVQAMIDIDEAFEHLKTIEKAGWKTPADHPDLVPAAEAGRLADLHRVLLDGDSTAQKPEGFAALMKDGNQRAQSLEDALVAGTTDAAGLSALLTQINASCKDCHVKYRD